MELGVAVDKNVNYGKLGKPYVRPSVYEQLKNGELE